MAITVSGTNITLNSGSVLQDPPGTAPSYLCRAWVNFKGSGTVTIRAAGNVSSITDNGTGDYTVNFTNAMSDANYCATLTGPKVPATVTQGIGIYATALSANPTTFSTTQLRLVQGASEDSGVVCVAIFR